MKLIASGDHHFDHTTRWEECIRIHRWIADLVRREKPDLFLSAGDVYERASTPEEREAVARFFSDVAGVCPVLIVKGNHDRPRDLAILRRLKALHPIEVEEAAGVYHLAGAAVAAVAWPNRAMLAAAVGEAVGGEVLDDVARDALRNVHRGLGMELAAHDGPRIAVGHWMIDGSMTSTGQPLIGAQLNVGLSDLALLQADIIIAGHIHLPQEWEVDGAPVVYTGSPRRTAFGEVEEKGVVLAEFDAEGRLDLWQRIQTPATPMLLFSAEWGDDTVGRGWAGDDIDPKIVEGAEVRLRYTVPADEREAAAARAEKERLALLEAGAVDVKVEEVVEATTRARAPEIVEARSLEDKLRTLWRARNTVPEEPRATRLIALAHQLEEDARA